MKGGAVARFAHVDGQRVKFGAPVPPPRFYFYTLTEPHYLANHLPNCEGGRLSLTQHDASPRFFRVPESMLRIDQTAESVSGVPIWSLLINERVVVSHVCPLGAPFPLWSFDSTSDRPALIGDGLTVLTIRGGEESRLRVPILLHADSRDAFEGLPEDRKSDFVVVGYYLMTL